MQLFTRLPLRAWLRPALTKLLEARDVLDHLRHIRRSSVDCCNLWIACCSCQILSQAASFYTDPGRNLLRLWTALHPFLLLAPRRGMLLGRKSCHKGSSAVEENALSLCIFVNLWVLAASIMKQMQLASLNGCRMRDLFPLPVPAQPGQPVAAVVGMPCHYVSRQVVS